MSDNPNCVVFITLEKSLKFTEVRSEVIPQNLLTFRKWRNFATEKRVINNKR